MRVGLDIGSTTIKCVVLNERDELVFSTYERHYSHILEKGRELLTRVAALIDNHTIKTTLGEHYGAITAANLQKAHRQLETGRAVGKIVLEGF